MGLSKLSEKCKKCPFVDKCENKRMEALGYISESHVLANSVGSNSENLVEPSSRETMTIMVDDMPTQVYKDEIEKQLYSVLGLKFGS